MNSAEKWLKILLRVIGVFCLPAFFAFVMPKSWMAAGHEWLGMGAFPDKPIAEYLARATSALCGFYGGLLIMLAADVHRYARIITFQAVTLLAIGAIAFVILLPSGMPMWWIVSDAGGAVVMCVAMLVLQRRVAVPGTSQ